VSLEGLNSTLGVFFRSQLDRRSSWLKALLVFLGLLVVANVAGIKPHEAAKSSAAGEATHGESAEGTASRAEIVPPPHMEAAGGGQPLLAGGQPGSALGAAGGEAQPAAAEAEGQEPAPPQAGAGGHGGEGEAGGAPATGMPEAAEAVHGEAGHGGAGGGPEQMLQAAGVEMNYYPQGAHTYNLTRWVSKNAVGRAVLEGFHYIHSSEAFPGFWALFGVLIAVLLVRVAKGAAHTFLGKGEDFYDR
jgi:hypothetical protein